MEEVKLENCQHVVFDRACLPTEIGKLQFFRQSCAYCNIWEHLEIPSQNHNHLFVIASSDNLFSHLSWLWLKTRGRPGIEKHSFFPVVTHTARVSHCLDWIPFIALALALSHNADDFSKNIVISLFDVKNSTSSKNYFLLLN